MKKLILLSLCTFSILLGSISNGVYASEVKQKQNGKELTLTIIHMNDHHSHLEADSEININIDGKPTKVKLGGMAEAAYEIKKLKRNAKNPLVLHAGDAITGTLYFTLFEGKADAEVMNNIGFDLFTLGNHEFDLGNEGLKKFLDYLKVPVISSNVIPDKDSILEGYWKPYVIKEIDGEKVGIIGLDVVKKTAESSSPGEDIKFVDEIVASQKAADELTAQGINKIILLSHGGTEKNLEIAEKVTGIDVIVTGDTHLFYGNRQLKEMGLPYSYEYPTIRRSPNGEPVLVVEGWEYSKFVGNLEVTFSEEGIIYQYRRNPKILISPDSSFERRKEDKSKYIPTGVEKEKIIKEINSTPWLVFSKKDEEVEKILSKYVKEKEEKAKEVIGTISGSIMPGGSSNRIPGTKESNSEGSIATRFVAETMLAQMANAKKKLDFTIQNSGGVRANIVPGEVTFNDAYTFLPFGNTLYQLEITGEEVKTMLEQALQYALVDGSTGAFPYGAGIRYEAIEDAEVGNRVKKIEVLNYNTNEWELLKNDKVYVMGTNAYLAAGKDGYKILGEITSMKDRFHEDTFLPDAESFISFLKSNPDFKSYSTSNVVFTPSEKRK